MNYKRKKDELSLIAKKIFDYKFKREALKIYEGAHTTTILEYTQWEERCKALLDTFFTRDGTNSGIILFPDIERAVDNHTPPFNIWARAMSILNNWCKNSSPEDATGLIVRNYDLQDHFCLRGITEKEIKDTLGFNNSRNMFSFQENDKRLLAFNPSLKIIFIIRLIELRKGELQLNQEVDHCIDEVNLLCFLLKNELAYTGVIVTGLVAYSGENAHGQSGCKDCDNIIVSFEIFNSDETFKSFLENFFSEEENKHLVKSVARYEKNDKADVFQAVASKILGYLSHLQYVTLREPVLPVTEQDATGNIKQAELLLNRYQMEIAYSDDKRIWLEGNYGTGKTVVALKKLELLVKALKDKEVIYYVNFARKSLLDLHVKQIFGKYENVRTIKGEHSLSDIIKHQILPKEKEQGTKNIHLIVDKYSSQDLSTEEVESLTPILNDEEELKKSTFLIAVQPIKINRVEYFYEMGIKRQFSETKHELDKLRMATGIKVRTLKNVMRTTVQINNLAKFTREYLDKGSNRCVRQQQSYGTKPSIDFPYRAPRFQPEKVIDYDEMYSLSSVEDITDERNYQETVTSYSYTCDSQIGHGTKPSIDEYKISESSTPLSVTPDDSSYRAPPFPPKKLIDYDEIYPLLHTEYITDKRNYQETVTSYSYTCDSQIGHGIKGPLPRLIKLDESADLNEHVALIAAVFYEVIAERKPIRIAVIHFEHEDPPLWLKSLFQLKNISKSITVTENTEEFLKDTRKKLVLVKNLKFLRGLEFSKVLLILDSNEHHLRHLIPEAITRCMEDLTILIRPPVHRDHRSNTVEDLAVEWEKNMDNGLLRILKIKFCSEPSCKSRKVHSSFYCNNEISFGTCYRFHQNSTLYKDFLKEIQQKKVRNVQPKNKGKQRRAEAA